MNKPGIFRLFPPYQLPRRLRDRSKYLPHQGKQECERRRRQMGEVFLFDEPPSTHTTIFGAKVG